MTASQKSTCTLNYICECTLLQCLYVQPLKNATGTRQQLIELTANSYGFPYLAMVKFMLNFCPRIVVQITNNKSNHIC